MQFSYSLLKALFLFFVVSGFHLYGEELLDLRHHFQVGDVYSIQRFVLTESCVDGIKDVKHQFVKKFSETLTILQVDEEGNAKARMTYDDISVSGLSQKEEKLALDLYPKGYALELVLKSSGEVLAVSGQEVFYPVIAEKIANSTEKQTIISNAFNNEWNETNLKKKLSQAFCIFPNQSISSGQSWERSVHFEFDSGVLKDITTTFTVLSPFDIQLASAAKIEFTKQIQGKPISYTLLSKGRGSIKIASEEPLGFTSTITQQILGTGTAESRLFGVAETKITHSFKFEKQASR